MITITTVKEMGKAIKPVIGMGEGNIKLADKFMPKDAKGAMLGLSAIAATVLATLNITNQDESNETMKFNYVLKDNDYVLENSEGKKDDTSKKELSVVKSDDKRQSQQIINYAQAPISDEAVGAIDAINAKAAQFDTYKSGKTDYDATEQHIYGEKSLKRDLPALYEMLKSLFPQKTVTTTTKDKYKPHNDTSVLGFSAQDENGEKLARGVITSNPDTVSYHIDTPQLTTIGETAKKDGKQTTITKSYLLQENADKTPVVSTEKAQDEVPVVEDTPVMEAVKPEEAVQAVKTAQAAKDDKVADVAPVYTDNTELQNLTELIAVAKKIEFLNTKNIFNATIAPIQIKVGKSPINVTVASEYNVKKQTETMLITHGETTLEIETNRAGKLVGATLCEKVPEKHIIHSYKLKKGRPHNCVIEGRNGNVVEMFIHDPKTHTYNTGFLTNLQFSCYMESYLDKIFLEILNKDKIDLKEFIAKLEAEKKDLVEKAEKDVQPVKQEPVQAQVQESAALKKAGEKVVIDKDKAEIVKNLKQEFTAEYDNGWDNALFYLRMKYYQLATHRGITDIKSLTQIMLANVKQIGEVREAFEDDTKVKTLERLEVNKAIRRDNMDKALARRAKDLSDRRNEKWVQKQHDIKEAEYSKMWLREETKKAFLDVVKDKAKTGHFAPVYDEIYAELENVLSKVVNGKFLANLEQITLSAKQADDEQFIEKIILLKLLSKTAEKDVRGYLEMCKEYRNEEIAKQKAEELTTKIHDAIKSLPFDKQDKYRIIMGSKLSLKELENLFTEITGNVNTDAIIAKEEIELSPKAKVLAQKLLDAAKENQDAVDSINNWLKNLKSEDDFYKLYDFYTAMGKNNTNDIMMTFIKKIYVTKDTVHPFATHTDLSKGKPKKLPFIISTKAKRQAVSVCTDAKDLINKLLECERAFAVGTNSANGQGKGIVKRDSGIYEVKTGHTGYRLLSTKEHPNIFTQFTNTHKTKSRK